MVEFSRRKTEIRGEGGNHHEKLELKRLSCASQCYIHDLAGTSPNPARTHTNMLPSIPSEASPTCDFSGPLVSSILF